MSVSASSTVYSERSRRVLVSIQIKVGVVVGRKEWQRSVSREET